MGKASHRVLWPSSPESGQPIVFLLDASSRFERHLLDAWIERERPAGEASAGALTISLPASRRRGRGARNLSDLEACIAQGEDPLLAPLRIAWLPKKRPDGSRRVGLGDIWLGDPRDPGPLRQRWVARSAPDRCRVVAGEPAPLSELREHWRAAGGQDASETAGLGDFIVRRANLALERAERKLRGARYKVPLLLREDILAQPAFRGALARLARELGESEARVSRRAAHYLREIAAAHSPTMIDLSAQFFRFFYRRGYQRLAYEPGELETVAALSQLHPVVFLPSHKSNLDHPALFSMLYENGLPPTHTAGGINMNFFPLGPIVRRSGVFFIRRSFKDNEIYKLVLRHYIDYLIEKRFSLEWYIEGGRSRSGKLMPPRFGLLAYVVDAYRRGKSEDVVLVPTSIAYDQIQDVPDYVAEQRGGEKRRESFRWFVGILQRLRRYGEIQIRLGEPVSLAKSLGPPSPRAVPNPDEANLSLQKLAFEVCVRINEATPITPTSLVTLALLGFGDRALTVPETRGALEALLHYAERRDLPRQRVAELRHEAGVRAALETLERSEVVTSYAGGSEPVYRIDDDQHLAAAYYRNTVIHFFVTTAIAELSALRAAEAAGGDRRAVLIEEALALRDLLKFEFFFPERERFAAELRRELAFQEPRWETQLEAGGSAAVSLVRRFQPLVAHAVLRPFLEAYRVAADALVDWGEERALERGPFVATCLARGKQYTLQRRIRNPEAVSKSYFETAWLLFANRGLLETAAEPGGVALGARRAHLAAELADAVRRVDAIEALAAARRFGVRG